jgi:hypothetical protein
MTKKSYKTAKKWAHGMALPVMEIQDQIKLLNFENWINGRLQKFSKIRV